jgi:hypothetical protein
MEKPKLTIYLAGPISHCNERQKCEWRKTAKTILRKKGYACIDPADHTVDWHAYKEIIDIDKSDVVIANLWRESIGTVIGIVQARRSGKPVILVDPNYIDSAVLAEIVGEDHIVRNLEAAINKLDSEAISLLSQPISVEKKNGTSEPLSEKKLQRSVNTACSEAGLNDAILTVLVSKRALTAIKHDSKDGRITTQEIKQTVFDQLELLSNEKDKLYAEDLKQRARRLKSEWERQQTVKDEKRIIDQLAETEKDLRAQLEQCQRERDGLRLHLEFIHAEQKKALAETPTEPHKKPESIGEIVRYAQEAYKNFLVILDDAVKSADESPYGDFEKVGIALIQLAGYAKEKQAVLAKNENGGRPPGLKEWLKAANCSFEYAAHESKPTSNNRECQLERTVAFAGAKYVMEKHLKIGGGSPNDGCRIHFEFLEADHQYRILIGHVGRHLKISGC